MYKETLPYIFLLLIILYAFYNAYFRSGTEAKPENPPSERYATHMKEHTGETHFEEELSKIDTPEYTKQYIIRVINHGSDTLNFRGGMMEGGFASREDAPKIACYVMELSGKKCAEPYPENAAMFYTSICGGCHGDDGKGLGGTYPDLTRNKMLGIEKREAFLKEQIKQNRHRKETKSP